MGEAQLAVLDRIDGLLVSGSPSNVAPALYGVAESATPDQHDPARDATTLPLIRAALARGLPLLAICRGIQELNVALGGTLHQQVHAVADRQDHRSGPGTLAEKFGLKHTVLLSGQLARIIGRSEIKVNSLHWQAIDRPAERLVVEAVAEDVDDCRRCASPARPASRSASSGTRSGTRRPTPTAPHSSVPSARPAGAGATG